MQLLLNRHCIGFKLEVDYFLEVIVIVAVIQYSLRLVYYF